MTPTIYLWLAKFAIGAAVLGAIFAFGYRTAENKLQPEINTLTAKIEAIDMQAKKDEIKYKENLDAIQKKSKRDRAAVDDYYRGLLSKTSDSNGSSETSDSAEGLGTAPGQLRLTSCSLETEKRCVSDALRVMDTAEFFKVNGFPVED